MIKHSPLELPDESIAEIVSLFHGSAPRRVLADGKNQAFWSACETVAKAQGMDLEDVELPSEHHSTEDLLQHLADAAFLRYRLVVLGPGWWRSDPGPLLVFEKTGRCPAAVGS